MELDAIYKQPIKKTWQFTNIGLKYFNCGIKEYFKKNI